MLGHVREAGGGTVVSIVLVHVGVRIGALASKKSVPWLAIAVAWARPALGITVKVTAPWPFLPSVSGGSKPSVGSLRREVRDRIDGVECPAHEARRGVDTALHAHRDRRADGVVIG